MISGWSHGVSWGQFCGFEDWLQPFADDARRGSVDRPKVGWSLLAGAIITWGIITPILLSKGIIHSPTRREFTRSHQVGALAGSRNDGDGRVHQLGDAV